jgi:hypothetical protein
MAGARLFRDNDEWVQYVRTLYRVQLLEDSFTSEADYLSDRDRRYVLRLVTNLKRYRLAVLEGYVPSSRDTRWREWNVLADLILQAYRLGVTLGEYLEDFEEGTELASQVAEDTL